MYILSSTKQNIDCTIRNQTNYQFYKKKQKQKISCTSRNKTKDQLYKQKQNKRSVVQA